MLSKALFKASRLGYTRRWQSLFRDRANPQWWHVTVYLDVLAKSLLLREPTVFTRPAIL
jgi:hypothetical protein